MENDECFSGRAVWATFGRFGWRAAVVICNKPRKAGVWIRYTSGALGNGHRQPSCLRPRDPIQRGKDKPTPDEARRAASVDRYPAWGGT